MAAQTRCIRCGKPVEGLTQFCVDCLAQQREQTPLGSPIPPTARPAGCPRCGTPVPDGAAFCGYCGAPVSGAGPGAAGIVAGVEYAGFWMRFAAFIIDAIILNVIGLVVGLIADDFGARLALGVLIGAAYDIGFWVAADGATPGKMALGIKVRMENGDPIDVGRAFLRWIGYYVSAFILLIGFIMIAFTPQKRGLHDYIAGTVVVKAR